MISSIGENLDIIISCNYTVPDNWMAFLCWYSLSKNLPDAKVVIACNRTLMDSAIFDWPRKCQIPFELHKCMSVEDQIAYIQQKKLVGNSVLVLKPDTIAVRDFEEAEFNTNVLMDTISQAKDVADLCCEAKEEKPCVLATYSNGWGQFVTSSWIHKVSCPFGVKNQFSYGNMTVNETRIGRLWGSVAPLFENLSGH